MRSKSISIPEVEMNDFVIEMKTFIEPSIVKQLIRAVQCIIAAEIDFFF